MNPELKRRSAIAVVLVLTLWASWKLSDDSERPVDDATSRAGRMGTNPRPTTARPAEKRVAAVEPGGSKATRPLSLQTGDVSTLAWPVRSEAKTQIEDIFLLRSVAAAKPEVAAAPSAPPLGLSYVGRMDEDAQSRVFVSDASGTVLLVAAGEKFPNGWRLVSTDNGRLVFHHDAMNQEQIIPTGVFK